MLLNCAYSDWLQGTRTNNRRVLGCHQVRLTQVALDLNRGDDLVSQSEPIQLQPALIRDVSTMPK